MNLQKPTTEKEMVNKSLDVYTLEQVAEAFEMHPQTLRRYIKEGKLQASKVGARILISRDSIIKMLDENVIDDK